MLGGVAWHSIWSISEVALHNGGWVPWRVPWWVLPLLAQEHEDYVCMYNDLDTTKKSSNPLKWRSHIVAICSWVGNPVTIYNCIISVNSYVVLLSSKRKRMSRVMKIGFASTKKFHSLSLHMQGDHFVNHFVCRTILFVVSFKVGMRVLFIFRLLIFSTKTMFSVFLASTHSNSHALNKTWSPSQASALRSGTTANTNFWQIQKVFESQLTSIKPTLQPSQNLTAMLSYLKSFLLWNDAQPPFPPPPPSPERSETTSSKTPLHSANSGKATLLIAQILDIHRQLSQRTDLEPCEEVNNLFA